MSLTHTEPRRSKVFVVGRGEGAEGWVRSVIDLDLATVVHSPDVGPDAGGARVAVIVDRGDGDAGARDERVAAWARQLARRCPAAVLVALGDRPTELCRVALEASLFPRARVLAIDDGSVATAIVESVLLDRRRPIECALLIRGEQGAPAGIARSRCRIGWYGVEEVVAEDSPPD